MGKAVSEISDDLKEFILAQPLYFVATAPLAQGGHVNLSPKGLDTFRVLTPTRVAYLDLTGSGNETAAHLAENGRITIMFCSTTASPRILRLFGRGRVVLPGDAEWAELVSEFPQLSGIRQIIVADVHRVQTSCGFGVPTMEKPRQRDTLLKWADAKGAEGLERYRREKNAVSIDGLVAPGMAREGD
ncbi:MAG: pyridoxamine 5'-phosphate oxidase family protein [Gemmatimonadota bacterium]